jgi:hypothetical protein
VDRITKSLLDEFSKDTGLTALPEDKRFEHFASYLVGSRHLTDTFDTSDLVVGSGGDTGIDAIITIVNGALITDVEAIEELAAANNYIDASFIFVQAERSPSFETAKIGQFTFGVLDFFSDKPKLARNNHVTTAAEVMTAVYKRSSKFKRGNPICKLFYVTTGKWTNDKNLEARRRTGTEDLEQLGIFREVEFTPVGADEIQKYYNQTKNAVSCEFTFADRTVIPEMPGVKEAYLGLLPAREFLRLLDDGSGGMLRTIFYDNVRDWQDYNAVNSEIKTTLESPTDRRRFALMNNGVTVIAKTLNPTGNKIYIEDYQIVNGCQTSHVLFDNRSLVENDDSVVIPLRLISSSDENVIASIVKATNRQTEVKEEQLLALSDFQKKLETYFGTFDASQRLYYERRSRQYSSAADIEKTRIVTLANLIRAYASIFLSEPHRTTRTYSALTQQIGRSIFASTDRLEPYYYAASALYRLEFLFRNGQLDPKYKAARYHILMAARMLKNPKPPPPSNSHEMAKYCEPLTSQMWDATKAERLLSQAAEIVEAAAGGNFHRDAIRTQPFTEEVAKRCGVKVKFS